MFAIAHEDMWCGQSSSVFYDALLHDGHGMTPSRKTIRPIGGNALAHEFAGFTQMAYAVRTA